MDLNPFETLLLENSRRTQILPRHGAPVVRAAIATDIGAFHLRQPETSSLIERDLGQHDLNALSLHIVHGLTHLELASQEISIDLHIVFLLVYCFIIEDEICAENKRKESLILTLRPYGSFRRVNH